jgi:ADP-ribose pyrophosphatase
MSEQNPQDNQGGMDQEIYRGKLITVHVRTVRKPDGGESRYEIVEHPGAVAIVAVRYESRDSGEPLVALVHQQRPAIGKETLEIPAGLVDAHERDHPEQTAARELREETGYSAGTLRLLTREYSSPGFTNEAISIYLATDVAQAEGGSAPDPGEIRKVQWMPLSEAMRLAREGSIDDGKTLIGLWLARDVLTADAFQD